MRFQKFLLIAVSVIVIIVGSVSPMNLPFKNLTISSVGGTLGGLFVLVLLIERVTEIAISIWRQPTADRLTKSIEMLAEATRTAEVEELGELKMNLASYKSETKSIALQFSFAISIVTCMVGVGIFTSLFDYSGITSGNQKTFVRGTDIVLTAGLLSGGSDAFHQFTSALENFFKSSKPPVS
jgi:hypothetical protein